jgi:anti-sigma B factor antagonist
VATHSSAPSGDGQPGAVQVLVEDDATHVVLSGEIDSDLGGELQQAAGDAAVAGRPVRVDTTGVTFMDSAGLAFLARLCGISPDRVRVLVSSPTVRFLLEMTGMAEAVEVVDVGAGTPGPARAGDALEAQG